MFHWIVFLGGFLNVFAFQLHLHNISNIKCPPSQCVNGSVCLHLCKQNLAWSSPIYLLLFVWVWNKFQKLKLTTQLLLSHQSPTGSRFLLSSSHWISPSITHALIPTWLSKYHHKYSPNQSALFQHCPDTATSKLQQQIYYSAAQPRTESTGRKRKFDATASLVQQLSTKRFSGSIMCI